MAFVARLFVALYPPRAAAVELLACLERLELPEHRVARIDQLHLTALFVGEVHEREVEAVAESVERSAAGVRPFTLAPDSWVALPARGPARLVAATAPAPSALIELRRRLVGRLAFHRKKSPTFLPHFTLCRFARPTAFELDRPFPGVEPFEMSELLLMRSRLGPEGADHRLVARHPLGG